MIIATVKQFCKTISKPYKEIKKEVLGFKVTGVRSTGPGGQCVNTRSSAADLKDPVTGIRVKSTVSRDFETNKNYARKTLIEKLDLHYNGKESKIAQRIEKKQKAKAKKVKRSKEKYEKLARTPPGSSSKV